MTGFVAEKIDHAVFKRTVIVPHVKEAKMWLSTKECAKQEN